LHLSGHGVARRGDLVLLSYHPGLAARRTVVLGKIEGPIAIDELVAEIDLQRFQCFHGPVIGRDAVGANEQE